MTVETKPAARRPWSAPRVDRLASGNAEAGYVQVNPENLGQGS